MKQRINIRLMNSDDMEDLTCIYFLYFLFFKCFFVIVFLFGFLFCMSLVKDVCLLFVSLCSVFTVLI